jgi:hypothetical protein
MQDMEKGFRDSRLRLQDGGRGAFAAAGWRRRFCFALGGKGAC